MEAKYRLYVCINCLLKANKTVVLAGHRAKNKAAYIYENFEIKNCLLPGGRPICNKCRRWLIYI